MAWHHHPVNGPEKCNADPNNPNSTGCPFGGHSGVENHYDSKEEAEESWGIIMEETYGSFSTVLLSFLEREGVELWKGNETLVHNR